MRKTKIVCTLGPASVEKTVLSAMLEAGMNVARINCSHGTYEEHQKKIDVFKTCRREAGTAAALLLDTKGPEIRLKTFEHGKEKLLTGQKFSLNCSETEKRGTSEFAAISYSELYNQVEPGNTILIDDGKVELMVDEVNHHDIICTVIRGGTIGDKKGVNVPDVKLEMEYLSERDREDLLFGIRNDIDYVAASFVRRADDVKVLRAFLDENGGQKIKIISKIENQEGIDGFEEILAVSDGIMVARGDMGVEVDFEKLPGIQKEIIRRCKEDGKISITATQMLDSMTEAPMPTRAEITDVANAVFDGTSAVMLSGETAVGAYPVETVRVMAKILRQAEEDAHQLNFKINYRGYDKGDVSDAVSHAACQAANDLDVPVIIAITTSGYTSEKISKYRPPTLIIASTPNEKTYYQQSLVWGVYPILTGYTSDWEVVKRESIKKANKIKKLISGNQIVISAGMPLQESGKTNMLMIEQVEQELEE